jgi:hypothetical protein
VKNLAFLGGVAGLGLAALLAGQLGHAADHLDSPTLVATPMADINDVYTWMDGTKLNLAMTISPVDADARTFGPGVQYVFHVHSKSGIGVGVAGTGTETRVICTFVSNTSAECWVADPAGMVKDYISGDPSNTAGISSNSGKMRLFAGRRSDPFFFNLQGFREAIKAVKGAVPALMYDAAGCPTNLSNPQVQTVAGNLAAQIPLGEPPCPNATRDCFAGLNVKVILVQVEKSLVTATANTAVGVWASTHQGS